MRKLFLFLFLALASTVAHAQQYAHYQNFCTAGGAKAVVQGLGSSNFLLSTFPGCTVTVYQAGTTTPVAIASTTTGTPLSNPFTATTTGYFTFYTLQTIGAVDVKMSGTGMTTTTLANVLLENSGTGVTSINGVGGQFTFTGSGVSCASTTCTFDGGGGGGFTVAQYNSLIGLPNSSGSTNAALFAAGSQAVFAGINGPLDSICPPRATGGVGTTYHTFPNYQTYTCYQGAQGTTQSNYATFFSPINGTSPTGGGTYRANFRELYDAGPGLSFFGGWHFGNMMTENLDSTTPGIIQMHTGSYVAMSPGDKALDYWYFNFRGGLSTSSDEGVTMMVHHMVPLGSYHGTINGNYASGASTIFTTQTSTCGGIEGGGQNNCATGGLVLLKLSTAVPITVATLTTPSFSTNVLGTMTFPETLTPSPGAISITNSTTSTSGAGQTFTSPFTTISGTMPSSGLGCWFGASSMSEVAKYSISGSTITITNQRYPHAGSSEFWAGDCQYFDPTPDSVSYGSKFYFTAVIDTPHSIRWATYVFSAISNGSFLNSDTFKAGVAGRNVANLYRGARVLDVADPNAAVGQPTYITGLMHLEATDLAWVNGEAVEEALYPADSNKGDVMYCATLIPNAVCHSTDVKGPVATINDITVSNIINNTNGVNGFQPGIGQIWNIRTVAPGNFGLYTTLMNIGLLPTGTLFLISDFTAPIAGKSYGVIGWPGQEGQLNFRRDIHQWQILGTSTYMNGKTTLDGNGSTFFTTPSAALNLTQVAAGDPSTVTGDLWWNGRLKVKSANGNTDFYSLLSETMQYVGRVTTNGTSPVLLTVTGLTNANGHCSSQQIADTQPPVVNPMVQPDNGLVRYFESSGLTGQEIDIFCVVK